MKTPTRQSADRFPALLALLVLTASAVAGLVVLKSPAGGAPPAPAAADGTWVGRTKGGRRVEFTVRDGGITGFGTKVRAFCGSRPYTVPFEYPPGFHRKRRVVPFGGRGNFKVVFKGSARVSFKDDTRTLLGSLASGRINGSLEIEGLCRARTAFSARLSP